MATTGRTRVSSPVQHQMGRDGRVRRYDVWPDGSWHLLDEGIQIGGHVLIACDFEQIEMRLAAQLKGG